MSRIRGIGFKLYLSVLSNGLIIWCLVEVLFLDLACFYRFLVDVPTKLVLSLSRFDFFDIIFAETHCNIIRTIQNCFL